MAPSSAVLFNFNVARELVKLYVNPTDTGVILDVATYRLTFTS